MPTTEESNLALLANRTHHGMSNGHVKNPDVALATLCVLPFLDRIATELARIGDLLEARN
jgi:hypothetical protein